MRFIVTRSSVLLISEIKSRVLADLFQTLPWLTPYWRYLTLRQSRACCSFIVCLDPASLPTPEARICSVISLNPIQNVKSRYKISRLLLPDTIWQAVNISRTVRSTGAMSWVLIHDAQYPRNALENGKCASMVCMCSICVTYPSARVVARPCDAAETLTSDRAVYRL